MGAIPIVKKCVSLLTVIIVVADCEIYGKYFLEIDRLCSLRSPSKVIALGKDAKSGAIVEATSYFDTLTGMYPFTCQFRATSNEEMGIFAVIQKMRLRKSRITDECIDFVQFRHTNSMIVNENVENEEGTWGEKQCGDVKATELDITSLNPTDFTQKLPHAFIDKQGKVDVRIHVVNKTNKRGTLYLKVAFTSFRICNSDLGNTYKKCGADSCIWHKFFNDGILNCPFTSCVDENGCHFIFEENIKAGDGLTTKVTVAAIAGIFTMFVVFFIILWLFRHCSRCWNGSVMDLRTLTEMRLVPTMENVHPTAPPLTPQLDKDLPPSYESLFPKT